MCGRLRGALKRQILGQLPPRNRETVQRQQPTPVRTPSLVIASSDGIPLPPRRQSLKCKVTKLRIDVGRWPVLRQVMGLSRLNREVTPHREAEPVFWRRHMCNHQKHTETAKGGGTERANQKKNGKEGEAYWVDPLLATRLLGDFPVQVSRMHVRCVSAGKGRSFLAQRGQNLSRPGQPATRGLLAVLLPIQLTALLSVTTALCGRRTSLCVLIIWNLRIVYYGASVNSTFERMQGHAASCWL